MKTSRFYSTIAALLVGMTFVSCGGGSGTQTAGGGIGGTGISVGTITGFGSVFVNGVEFDTSDAFITVDGTPASESDLGIGMVVAVEGTFNKDGLTGKADRITYEPLVRGPVDSIDLDEESLVVLGRTVSTSDDTVFEGCNSEVCELETLAEGNIVEVSGFLSSDGIIRATRIEFKSSVFIPGTTKLEITGIVDNLDEAAETFTIGDQVVDFSGAELDLDELPGGVLENGSLVEVESTEDLADGVLVAGRVRGLESVLAEFAGFYVEMEGVVTEFTSPASFEVNGIPVVTNEATVYENGAPGDIAVDVRLEVEGSLDADGVLHATEIEFAIEGNVEIEADVQQEVDLENRTLVLLSITVVVDNQTVIWDNSAVGKQPFGLEDIEIGDRIVVIGNSEGNTVRAKRIERRNPEVLVAIKGPVTAVNADNLQIEIFGVTVVTTEETEFLDSNEVPLSAEDFFAEVQIGSIVEVEGSLMDGNIINAEEIESEN
jgi:hypothetical protein